ncbi:MAG: DUF29 domain-containing protein [Aphanothece sp. CMT-3BRIN-NPC111]|nr:DUF29 domain-containing protein [Aphanothece sp. CMT-3BRIN-NPC111]
MTTNLNKTSVANSGSLYEEDFYLWIQTTANQIRQKNFEKVDWENLLEELESLGRSDKRELENRLTVLLEHLLKLVYWKEERENNTRGWANTIKEQRRQIKKLLKSSPSLKPFLLEAFAECYSDARVDTADNSGLSLETFPEQPPFSFEQVLNSDYLPE